MISNHNWSVVLHSFVFWSKVLEIYFFWYTYSELNATRRWRKFSEKQLDQHLQYLFSYWINNVSSVATISGNTVLPFRHMTAIVYASDVKLKIKTHKIKMKVQFTDNLEVNNKICKSLTQKKMCNRSQAHSYKVSFLLCVGVTCQSFN